MQSLSSPFDCDPDQRWRKYRFEAVLDDLCANRDADVLTVIAVDGHSGSGKSSLASALAATERDATVVHADDLAWCHSMFDWDDLLVEHILKPLREQGPPVTYRPQAWIERNRPGAIEIPATTRLVIVEGVGVCRPLLEEWFDATVWVHARPEVLLRRVIAKGADSQAIAAAACVERENAFIAVHRPWTRADLLVAGELGQPSLSGKYGVVVAAPGPQRRMGTRA